MTQHQRGRNIKLLVGLILPAVAYGGWLHYGHTLTGMPKLDGIIGVLLGLYICSHPAANMLDMLLFTGSARRQTSTQADVLWVALNLLILLIGWLVIVMGTTRFTATI
jgi:hypothetical protein